MSACLIENGRCDPARPSIAIGSGEVLDPEASAPPICAAVEPSASLAAILADAYATDPARGVAGLTYSVELRVGAMGAPPEDDQFATKAIRVFARFPDTRTANRNPTILELQLLQPPNTIIPAALNSCAVQRPFPALKARTQVFLLPIETDDTRENYPSPTLDGTFENFDETMTYQYLATAGSLSDQFGGGPRDAFGNEPGLGTTWTAPDFATEAQLWMIQRDERGGVSVYPFCIRVQQ
jgi:hypothetical protein